MASCFWKAAQLCRGLAVPVRRLRFSIVSFSTCSYPLVCNCPLPVRKTIHRDQKSMNGMSIRNMQAELESRQLLPPHPQSFFLRAPPTGEGEGVVSHETTTPDKDNGNVQNHVTWSTAIPHWRHSQARYGRIREWMYDEKVHIGHVNNPAGPLILKLVKIRSRL